MWVQVPPPPFNLDLSVAANVTLPITLPQLQAYASKPISLRAALTVMRTSWSRKHPGLANSYEIAASLG
ncbi:hypothetical protein A6S26_23450 [Nostoc sp. ATCC 43529]|nr:hypothetical protein A6S26_23450 [Nostoc sp. ATCC 43529]